MITSCKVVAHDAEVVNADMGELRGSRHLADGPDAWRGRLEPFVDLDVAAIIQFDPGQLEPYILRVWTSPRRNKQMSTTRVFSLPSCSTTTVTAVPDLPEMRFTLAFRTVSMPSSLNKLRKTAGHIIIFQVQQAVISINDGNLAAEPAHRLR